MSLFSAEETRTAQPLKRLAGCGACKLYKQCRTPKMEPSGKGEKGILIIAEQPTEEDDRKGTQLVGESGQLLRKQLRKYGIDLEQDCRKINAISCHPPEGRAPEGNEIECCRPRVWKEIDEFRPRLILLLGNAAVHSFLGHRWKKDIGSKEGVISRWRGWTIPDRDVNAWVCPTFHPSYVIRADKEPVVEKMWKQDLCTAIGLLDKKVWKPVLPESKSVEILEGEDQIYDKLKSIYEWSLDDFITIDTENSGLKPQYPGHFIQCVSICMDDTAVVFDTPPEGKARAMLRKILTEPAIRKGAHNMKYDGLWLEELLPCVIEGWEWCSMINAHILDNREGVTGLKFQAYVNFGLLPYDEHIEPFLKGDGKMGANSFNRVHLAPRRELLTYCGIDALVTRRLASKQMKLMGVKI